MMAAFRNSAFWPAIYSSRIAIRQMHCGAGAAAFSAILTAALGVAAIYLDRPVLGLDAWSLIDAVVFAIVAWRIYRQSLPWAIAALALFTIEKVGSIIMNPQRVIGLPVATLFFLFYLHAVRGGLYLRKARKEAVLPAPPVSV